MGQHKEFYPQSFGAFSSSYLGESRTYKVIENNAEAYNTQQYIDGKTYAGPRIEQGKRLRATRPPQIMASVGPDGTEGAPRSFIHTTLDGSNYFYVPLDLLIKNISDTASLLDYKVNHPSTYPYNTKTRVDQSSVATVLPLDYQLSGSIESDLVPTITKTGSKSDLYYLVSNVSGKTVYVPVQKITDVNKPVRTAVRADLPLLNTSSPTPSPSPTGIQYVPGAGPTEGLQGLPEKILQKMKDNKIATAIIILILLVILITAIIIYRKRKNKAKV